ncbi:phospholipase A2 inhibitor and Ly6/PLAUR domain-containing protein-like [Podarcis raffonei]|uniref:phospholipase A2 inhibitor and Ly6/PLAUR domain-containing protein-like n=1 Tax=Podarcis raffonei TaxID=65483 RepID=UPI0023293862|nr:phospholipase A2 inhibitor and Ly6/PLAUR domain-containing protein-like [Podarcis raffonei]
MEVEMNQFTGEGSKDDSLEFRTETGCTTDCTLENYSFTTSEGDFILNFRECCHPIHCLQQFGFRHGRRLNGQECPTCIPSLSEACKGSETIKCYNDETQCMEFVVAYDDSAIPNKHFHGCASPKFCGLAKNPMHFDALSGAITKARCSDTLPPLEQLNIE